jgi:valyl-tRNA synthetase
MDKTWNHLKYEEKLYKLWEKSGVFTPKIEPKKKPFTIILPLPNASDPMHMGHALFTIEDIMVRYHRMLGEPTLWLPGGDHAGIETQYIFEKQLAKKGKSRFDFDRKTLYAMIKDFCDQNKDINKNQMKRLGFSLDWSRYHYSLEPEIIEKVLTTFRLLHKDGLVYRGERIVNYCTHCGTAFSELEINYKDRDDFLYTLDYGVVKIATTRPETIFADVAIAVNPKDKRYLNLVGKKATIPLIDIEIPIITDVNIDINFGTGALKVTPAHDETDFEIGLKNNLEVINILDSNGTIKVHKRVPKSLQGLTVNKAREKTLELLEKEGGLVKKENLEHSVGVCYRCGTTIEPMVMPQWFVKTKPLAAPAIKAVKSGKTKIFPKKRFEKMYFDWMENIRDWNISRQIVWGPRIPAWYCLECNPDTEISFVKKGQKIAGKYLDLSKKYSFYEIKNGLQLLTAAKNSSYQLKKGKCKKCGGEKILQETDTFDTWFLSGQWPLTTLGFNPKDPQKSSKDFFYFYPTSVMDTLWDILFFWVGRMVMFGLYLTGNVPFEVVHIHARVVDKHGKKMSKSKGNVVNPIEMVEKYGADALRMSLVMGIAPASDISISEEKILGMRNFANKVWNLGRYTNMVFSNIANKPIPFSQPKKLDKVDEQILADLSKLAKSFTFKIKKYRFGIASEMLYEFVWHRFADKYIEASKERALDKDPSALYTIRHTYLTLLKLLHPFMPFVTEATWQELKKIRKYPEQLLITSSWPMTK